jgi:hypothetical protein
MALKSSALVVYLHARLNLGGRRDLAGLRKSKQLRQNLKATTPETFSNTNLEFLTQHHRSQRMRIGDTLSFDRGTVQV